MFKKVVRYVILSLFIIFSTWYSWNHSLAQIPNTPIDRNARMQFEGTLLIASDADQVGTAYADGVINKVKNIEDSLTILQWNKEGNLLKSQLHISNSVISWPSIIDFLPDYKIAYIVETRGVYQGNKQKLKNVWDEMPKGSMVSVVDVSDFQNPKILQKKPIALNPKTVSVNVEGDLLLVASAEKGKEIIIATLKNGLIDTTFSFSVVGLSRKGTNGGVNFAGFHPSLNIFAVILDNRNVGFYQIIKKNENITIEPLGDLIEAGKVLSVGNFTPDGKYFIVADVGWGDSSLGNVFNDRGYLISIQCNQQGKHQLINKVKVGLSPEGFDISPNGKWAVAVNMRRTYLPKGFPYSIFAARKLSSLSLIKINQNTGELQTIGKEYGFEGELPEDAVFDSDSKTIAVTIYNNRFEQFPKQGYIEFWNLEDDKLIRTSSKILVTRGCHNLKMVK